MRSLFCLIFLLFLVSCSNRNKVPANVMGIQRMNEIMWDLSRADALVVNRSYDSSFDKKQESIKLYEQIFQLHNTTREKFMKSLTYYQQNPEMLKVMMDSLRGYERRIMEAPVSQPPVYTTDTGQSINPVIEKATRERDSINRFKRLTKPVRD